MSSSPPLASSDLAAEFPAGVLVNASDPAKLLVRQARFFQPTLALPNGGRSFRWPAGTEGIKISGSASISEHKYFDDNKVVVKVTHRDSRRIVLSGMFSGTTAQANVRELLDVITAEQPPSGKILTVPGVFLRAQKVAVADYDFDHSEDDRTDSFAYTVTFTFLGVGDKVKSVKKLAATSSMRTKSGQAPERGKKERVFVVRDGASTLRAIAGKVYRNPNRWREIYNKNRTVLNSLNVQLFQLPTKPLPPGLRLFY